MCLIMRNEQCGLEEENGMEKIYMIQSYIAFAKYVRLLKSLPCDEFFKILCLIIYNVICFKNKNTKLCVF